MLLPRVSDQSMMYNFVEIMHIAIVALPDLCEPIRIKVEKAHDRNLVV